MCLSKYIYIIIYIHTYLRISYKNWWWEVDPDMRISPIPKGVPPQLGRLTIVIAYSSTISFLENQPHILSIAIYLMFPAIVATGCMPILAWINRDFHQLWSNFTMQFPSISLRRFLGRTSKLFRWGGDPRDFRTVNSSASQKGKRGIPHGRLILKEGAKVSNSSLSW